MQPTRIYVSTYGGGADGVGELLPPPTACSTKNDIPNNVTRNMLAAKNVAFLSDRENLVKKAHTYQWCFYAQPSGGRRLLLPTNRNAVAYASLVALDSVTFSLVTFSLRVLHFHSRLQNVGRVGRNTPVLRHVHPYAHTTL
jgi:hypothetical protein